MSNTKITKSEFEKANEVLQREKGGFFTFEEVELKALELFHKEN